MAAHSALPLVTWQPRRKRRAKARTFLERHRPSAWHVALMVGFIVLNETRGLVVAVQIFKAWTGV